MFKPERILVPTDFSEKGKQTSKLAVKQAIAIADEHDAELIFLHVITTEVEKKPLFFLDDDKFGELRKDLRANAKKALDAFAKKYIGERKIRYRVKVREGVAYNEILKEERESEVDLVTIATRGHSALHDFFYGSTTEKVVRRSACNVMVVRQLIGR